MPAVQEPPRPTSMSEDAFELVHRFYNGVDVVVRELAEQIAIQEGSFLEDKSTVAIEESHVRDAGLQIMERLRTLLKDGKLPLRASQLVSGMSNCFVQQPKS